MIQFFAGKRIKRAIKTSSLIAAILGWLLLSALNVFIFWQLQDRARLLRDNDNERTLNTLFTELRNYSDFGSAVESNVDLRSRIIGVAVYENDLRPVYQWGNVPPVFNEQILKESYRNRFGRYTIPDRRGRSAKFVLYYGRMGMPENSPPVPPGPPQGMMRPRTAVPQPGSSQAEQRQETRRQFENRQGPEQQGTFFFDLFRGRYFYIDISHPEYWRVRTLATILFPLTEIAMLILIFYIRRLYLRNREYREKIDAQQNLVVMGTAAGTLAHEIKNPLLSIRLQTGILEKLSGENGKDEINIINQEVDRLSALVYRVNDYLREPGGERAPLDISNLLAETSIRIFGKNIIDKNSAASAIIFADENRIRSVLENILRNALESGSLPAEIGAAVNIEGKAVGGAQNLVIRVFDRGRGIPGKDIKRVFDPFFTSKSTGTGIGLAISKRFTEAAGGSISIENRDIPRGGDNGEGGGLTVTLVFPVYTGEGK
ncbi:hypothetical protein AGMMS50293_18590 [Spirochaetia bacterium]|nr:hypothetical protein AGMMS50293_18590 [Spirochaetia bacterium]